MPDASLRETIEQADAETQPTEVTEVAEDTSTSEPSQDDTQLQELDTDEEFAKAKGEMESEQGRPLTLGQMKAFKKTYWEAKEGKRFRTEHEGKYTDLEAKYNELLDSQQETPAMTDEALANLAAQRGLNISKAQAKNMGMDEVLGLVQRSEDKEWFGKYNSAFKSQLMKELSEKYDGQLKEVNTFKDQYRIEQSLNRAKDHISEVNKQHGLTLDYAKDIDPEILSILRANPSINRNNADLYTLTKEVLANKGIGIGKKLALEEQRKLNETKKRAALETDAGASTGSKDYSGMSVSQIMKEAEQEHGYA